MNILVPLVELLKIPKQMEKVRNFFLNGNVVEQEVKDPPIFLQTMRSNPSGHRLFYVTLEIEGLLLHNFMVDTRETSNVMPLKIMERSVLKVSHPYKKIYDFVSKIVTTHGLIQGQRSHLHAHPNISFLMDIVVVDIPITYWVSLSKKWTSIIRGTIQMDLAYASIPNASHELVTLYKAPFMKYFIEDPTDPCNINETFV